MNVQTKLRLSLVSNWRLALLVMIRLWQQYDASGVSIRRSLRAHLIELIIGTHPSSDHMEEVETSDLIEEMKNRTLQDPIPDNQLMLDLGVRGLPDNIFCCFVIRELRRWYENDEKTQEYPLASEKRIVDALAMFLEVEEYLRQLDERGILYTSQELIDEGEERDHCYLANEIWRHHKSMRLL